MDGCGAGIAFGRTPHGLVLYVYRSVLDWCVSIGHGVSQASSSHLLWRYSISPSRSIVGARGIWCLWPYPHGIVKVMPIAC